MKKKPLIDAGTLAIKGKSIIQNVTTLNTTIYLLDSNKRYDLITIERSSSNGGILSLESIDGPLGRTVGNTIQLGTKILNHDAVSDQLFFELITTQINGTTNTYTLPLNIIRE